MQCILIRFQTIYSCDEFNTHTHTHTKYCSNIKEHKVRDQLSSFSEILQNLFSLFFKFFFSNRTHSQTFMMLEFNVSIGLHYRGMSSVSHDDRPSKSNSHIFTETLAVILNQILAYS